MLRILFKKHASVVNARRQALFWLALPTIIIVMLLALLAALQSQGVMLSLHYTFDQPNHLIINHSTWWVALLNITSAMLTIMMIVWFIALYFAVRSLKHYWQLAKPRTKKLRRKRALYWCGVLFIAVPIMLIIAWYGLGVAVQFVTEPMSQAVVASNYDLVSGYWYSYAIPEYLALALPFCVIVSIYCAVKHRKL
ncbi:MAG TPA: hypothetical protein VFQ70_00595 [Candidatus Saccharimonadaceae bacterium]|nr:hypothetical protein [Candidatus Saccharimonadaceae bacterium]